MGNRANDPQCAKTCRWFVCDGCGKNVPESEYVDDADLCQSCVDAIREKMEEEREVPALDSMRYRLMHQLAVGDERELFGGVWW